MKIEDSVALVTGANRGLGRSLVKALVDRGARRVYAAARDIGSVPALGPAVTPIRLDVTKLSDIQDAAVAAPDVTLLVNNAGISRKSTLLSDDTIDAARAEYETNVLGPLLASRAFAPILAAHGGGAIINILSVLSWLTLPTVATYSASKAAAWSITNGLRNELAAQRTQVLGVHVGFMDTDMARTVAAPKSSPEAVATTILDALEAGASEVLADELSRQVKLALSSPSAPYLAGTTR